MGARIALLVGVAVALGGAAAAKAATPAVEIKDAVAQVVVVPEDRTDVRVEIVAPNRRLPLKIKAGRTRTVVDGELHAQRIRGCRGSGADAVVRVAGVGDVPLSQMPRIVVHAPRDVDLSAGGAVFGSVGRTRNLNLGAAGCGDWTIANVSERLRLSLADAVAARAGASAEAKLRLAGSGEIATADVGGRLDVDLAGEGTVHVKSVAGPLDVHIAGSGDVIVQGGHAAAMTASVAGTGQVIFGGVADSLQARIVGSGAVRARQVHGPVTKAVVGPGVVRVG